MTRETANAFNLQTGPAPARAPAPLSAGETLRDSVAAAPPQASSLMKPIAAEGMAVGGMSNESPKAVRYMVITPRAEAWAKKHKFLAGLIAKPASFLLSRSSLGSARAACVLRIPKVDAYMNSPWSA